jgi:predicted transcriptional regulator
MSEAAIKQYINGASESKIDNLIKLATKKKEELEDDKAIRRALEDVKAGRVYTEKEVDIYLKKHIANLKKAA